jgi:hypothetical protein
MSEAIQKITTVLAQTNWENVENKTLKEEGNDVRPATDIKTEIPKQKSDLEIFNRIEENPFLPNFIDLDSEEFLHQRILWDFEADWHGK